jgi:hypothetical protein
MVILAMNKLGEALYSEMLANPRRPANSARFCFLDSRATTFFVDWEESADASVAVLRAEAGRNPHDRSRLWLFVCWWIVSRLESGADSRGRDFSQLGGRLRVPTFAR